MAQGIFIWLLTFVFAYLIISLLSQTRATDKRFLIILFFYHSLIAIAYYVYALYNPSDSRAYYGKVIQNYRGDDWLSFYGTSTTFVEFVGYPFVKYLDFSYESTMVVFAFVGFIGFVYFYLFFKENIHFRHHVFSIDLFTLIFFLPNLHFWSSSFGKGALIFCGFGLFMFAIVKPGNRIWALLLGGWIIFQIRPHIFYVVLIAVVLSYTFSTKGVALIYRLAILTVSVFLLYYIYDDVLRITGLEDESIFDEAFSNRALRLERATSGIDLASYSIPERLFTFWFRPLFFDAPGILGFIVSFENLFYLFFFGYMLQPRAISYLWSGGPMVKTCLLTFLGVSLVLAQITGNLGLAMRQKSQVMPLMLFVILKFMDDQKLLRWRRTLRGKQYRKQADMPWQNKKLSRE